MNMFEGNRKFCINQYKYIRVFSGKGKIHPSKTAENQSMVQPRGSYRWLPFAKLRQPHLSLLPDKRARCPSKLPLFPDHRLHFLRFLPEASKA